MQFIIYRMKDMLRQKSLLFWSLVFPILLGGLLYFMFGGIHELAQFDKVSVGILCSAEDMTGEQTVFVELMQSIETAENVPMFALQKYGDVHAAQQALQDKTIYGYIDLCDDMTLTIRKSDIYTSLIKTFLDQYRENVSLITETAQKHPEKVSALVENLASEQEVPMREILLKGSDKDPYAQYFYALIAMTCLIGTMVGVSNGNDIQADLSDVAARRNVAPLPKLLQVLYDFIATLILYCLVVTCVIAVCVFVYGQDFGSDAGYVLLGGYVGSFTALAIGTVITVFVRGSVQKKEGICVAVFMGSSFLAGLQVGNMIYLIEQKCPVINRINPGTLIVNSFKSLAVFGDYRQYAINLLTLFAIGVICVAVCVVKLRRTKYESL